MTNELEILKSVETENTITQRELAKRTGLSLGSVNVLIKRLINKGLLKIEHINAKTIRYILTPKGLMEKARLTYNYIVLSYNRILDIEDKLERMIESSQDSKKVILYGKKDELYEILSSRLKLMARAFHFIDDRNKLKQYNKDEYVVITWSPENIQDAFDSDIKIMNILNQN